MSSKIATRLLFVGCIALGAFGSFQALARSDEAPSTGPSSPCVGATGSFYLGRIETDGLGRDAFVATFIDMHPAGRPAHCPESVRIGACADALGQVLEDYACYLGTIDFGYRATADQTANEVSEAIAQRWQTVAGDLVHEDGAPVRAMVLHYPREGVPGRCVTVQATFSNAPDPARNAHLFQGMPSEDATFAGALLRVRKTYQLQGSVLRLVEAWVEVFDEVDLKAHPLDYAGLLGEPEIRADHLRDFHYEWLGRRRCWGLVWIDRSWGMAEPRPWARAFHAWRLDAEDASRSEVVPMPADWQVALRALVERL